MAECIYVCNYILRQVSFQYILYLCNSTQKNASSTCRSALCLCPGCQNILQNLMQNLPHDKKTEDKVKCSPYAKNLKCWIFQPKNLSASMLKSLVSFQYIIVLHLSKMSQTSQFAKIFCQLQLPKFSCTKPYGFVFCTAHRYTLTKSCPVVIL